MQSTRLRSPLQYAAAAAAVVAGGAHLVVTGDAWRAAPYLGVLFILVEIACAALAVLLYARDTPRVWQATALTGALAILGYAWSRAVGLPRLHDRVGNWTDPLGLLAVSAEALMCLLAVIALVRHRRPVAADERRSPSW